MLKSRRTGILLRIVLVAILIYMGFLFVHVRQQITDTKAIEGIVDEVIAKNQKAVDDYKGGNKKAIGALVGQVMKASKGKANPQMVNQLLAQKLDG